MVAVTMETMVVAMETKGNNCDVQNRPYFPRTLYFQPKYLKKCQFTLFKITFEFDVGLLPWIQSKLPWKRCKIWSCF